MSYDSQIETILEKIDFKAFPKDGLSPLLFQTSEETGIPTLHTYIRNMLLKDISSIHRLTIVHDAYLVGKCLISADPKTPVTVVVEVDENEIDKIAKGNLMALLDKLNGTVIPDTTHPINYIIVRGTKDNTTEMALYDFLNSRWLKQAKIPKKYERPGKITLYLRRRKK